MAEEMYGYTDENAREFMDKLSNYMRMDGTALPVGVTYLRSFFLVGGDKLDVFNINNATVIVESGSGKGKFKGINQRLEIRVGAKNKDSIARALTTLTEMTGKEFSRGRP